MTTLVGTYATSKGSKYLQQLCKHFAHKVEARCSDTEGFAALGFGETRFEADLQKLTVKIALNDATAAEPAQQMIDAHLERFAFREDFKSMNWSEA